MTHPETIYSEPVSESPVRIEEESIIASLPDGRVRLPLVSAPEELSTWLDEGRRAMYDQLLDNSGPVSFFAQHLPMVVSHNAESVFPFSCGNKGVGYLPRTEHLERFITSYRDTIEASKGKPWQESLRTRVEAASEFNLNPELIDRRCLVTLEIFERQTYRNLQSTPLASLLFTGHSPSFTSFQVNCAVEIIGPGDPRYTFITLARTMFEYDDFHITQHNFPYGYVFWLSECVSKTPFRVKRGANSKSMPGADARSMPWTSGALDALSRAPRVIQTHIQIMVERYARDRGFAEITELVVQEARENLMDWR